MVTGALFPTFISDPFGCLDHIIGRWAHGLGEFALYSIVFIEVLHKWVVRLIKSMT